MMEVPFEVNFVIILALISLLLSLMVLVFLLLNRTVRGIRRVRGELVPVVTFPQHLFRFVITFLWVAWSAVILFLAAFIQSYKSFTRQELVAEVRCRTLEEDETSMLLELTPVTNGRRGQPEAFVLKGEQWALEGDIIKWDDWMNFVGVHTQYKLTRVSGRFVTAADQRKNSPSVYSLVQDEESSRWRWLYKYGYRLRFVQAVYGNTVYTYPSDDVLYQVYVTTSGFMVDVGRDKVSNN